MKRCFGIATLLAAAVLAACSRGPMAGLRDAQVTPGEGVGALRLGMPLAEFTNRYGSGRLATLVGDDGIAVEMRFRNPDIAVLFNVNDACRAAMTKQGRAVAVVAGLAQGAAFFQKFPNCASVPLASIAVEDGSLKTDHGLHVGSSREEMLGAYTLSMPAPSISLAGDNAEDGELNRLPFDGLVAFFAARSEGTPNGALAPDAIVRRLVVVPRAPN